MRLPQCCVAMHLNPAKSIITKLGGVEAVADVTGKHVSRVYRWMYPRERGGTGGVIPHDDARKLMAAAADRGVEIDPAEFFEEPQAADEASL